MSDGSLTARENVAIIAIDQTVYHFDKPYSYLIPDKYRAAARPGVRVLVPFGRGNAARQGMILKVASGDTENLKAISGVLDDEPVLNAELIKLVGFLKAHTFCTFYDAIKTLLPAGVAMQITEKYEYNENGKTAGIQLSLDESAALDFIKSSPEPVTADVIRRNVPSSGDETLRSLCRLELIRISAAARQRMGDTTLKMARLSSDADDKIKKLTPNQRAVISLLRDTEVAAVKEIIYFTGASSAVVSNLVKKGILEFYDQPAYKNPYCDLDDPEKPEIVLSQPQQTAFETLMSKRGSGETALLYGITGSGKTQVFLKLADEVLASGQNVIVMVPEIALTPQTLKIFHKRYGSTVAVFHSAMSMGQRMDEWKRVRDGKARIVVGTRSAVFAPLTNIGLIIIDEEQEHTYKSEGSPRYHAREVAAFRCRQHSALLLLASATPSVESYFAAKSGRHTLCTLPGRYGTAELPEVITIDMSSELAAGNSGAISAPLLELLQDNLKCGFQSILLLNRRGHNTYVSCRSCGHVMSCPNCSISLTYHLANNRLMCHYCGHSELYTHTCPSCGAEHMKYSGLGTQRVEAELKALLPDARVLRLDADNTLARGHFDAALNDFSNGEYDIMLGTQMVAKGLDFPKVTLVGVLAADRALYAEDFRGYERAFSLITQVVGRSGRGDFSGKAVIQTMDTDHSIIDAAASQDYDKFYDTEIALRKIHVYPPFCDIVMVGFTGLDKNEAEHASQRFSELLVEKITEDFPDVKVTALRPVPASIPKVNNKYRFKLLIKCRVNKRTRELIDQLMLQFPLLPESKNITAFVDVNPMIII